VVYPTPTEPALTSLGLVGEMKRAFTAPPKISEENIPVSQWSGLNTFGPHADLKPGEFRALANFDNFGGYIKTRRGSEILIQDLCPNENIIAHAVFDAGEVEYVVIQQSATLLSLPTGLYNYATASNPAANLTNFILYVDLSNMTSNWWAEVDTTIGAKGRAAKDSPLTQLATDWIQFDPINKTGFVRIAWVGTLGTASTQLARVYPPKAANATLAKTDPFGSNACYDPAKVEFYAPNGGNDDRSSNALTFTEIGGVVSGDSIGQNGAATEFNGSTQYLEANIPSTSKPITMMGWVYPTVIATNGVLSGVLNSDSTMQIELSRGGSGRISMSTSDPVPRSVQTNDSTPLSAWSHTAGTVGGTVISPYANGLPRAVPSGTMAGDPTIDNIKIGADATGTSRFFSGLLQELFHFSDVKTDEWIAHEYSQTTDNAAFWGTWADATADSTFRFCELSETGTWQNVLNKSDLSDYVVTDETEKVDMFVSNGKIYVFSLSGNSIFEWDSATSKFLRRKMGLPSPTIRSVVGTESGGTLAGRRVYGVELIYKNENVSPAVDLIASGPNRQVEQGSLSFAAGRLAYTDVVDLATFVVSINNVCNDGTNMESTINDNWTHLRLYRSKDLTAITNSIVTADGTIAETEITGRVDELFQVAEVTRATYLADVVAGEYAFPLDNILDDDFLFPNSPVLKDKLEIVPFANAKIGVYHRDRIWGSGVVEVPSNGVTSFELDSISSKIFYTPDTEANSQYSESMGVLNAVDCEAGDGQDMVGLYVFREDLVGIKQGKTGRIPYGDPNRGWITEDVKIGITDRAFAQFVPNIGLCAIVNDQNDFRIFGFDLQWKSNLFGLQLSRPIREIIKTFTPEDIDFIYFNGKLIISGGKGVLLVLAVEQRQGWSLYMYPLNGLSEALLTFGESTRACILNPGQPGIEIEIEDVDTDYSPVTSFTDSIAFDIITHKWQDLKGRSLIEQRYLSVVADLNTNISCQPFVNGKIWDIPFTLLPDPQDYDDEALRETEYQGFSPYKPIGNYIHYQITGFAPAIIYSLSVNALIQRGSIPRSFDPFQVLPRQLPTWVSITTAAADAGTVDSRAATTFTAKDAGTVASRALSTFTANDAGDANRSA